MTKATISVLAGTMLFMACLYAILAHETVIKSVVDVPGYHWYVIP